MNKRYELFLSWWLKAILISVGVIICAQTGVWSAIWLKDASKLSYLILSLFGLFSVLSGYTSFKLSKNPSRETLEAAEKSLGYSWFWSSKFQMLGMIGTVVGFIMVLGGNMDGLDSQNLEQFKEFVINMSVGLSTALYTTLIGLVCSFLLRLQIFPLQYYLDKTKNEKV